MKHAQRRVVITGASSGIGAATAIAFAAQGCHLVLGARGKAGLDDIARRCRAAGGTADTAIVDVTDAAAVAAFAAEARAALGGIDVWFSAPGIGVVGKYLDVPLADHRQVIETNLLGHMHDAYAVLPIFLEQDHGTWVNMISAGAYVAAPYAAAYSASKFGLRGFSEALRAELRGRPQIHVCDVHPTFVDTPAIYHAGNYTGARLTFPPGALPPEKVAAAIVDLARRPRDVTAVGAPAIALTLAGLATPCLSAAMNRFMERWTRQTDPAGDTSGTMHAPPAGASGISSGRQRPDGQRNKALMVGAGMAAAVIGLQLLRKRSA